MNLDDFFDYSVAMTAKVLEIATRDGLRGQSSCKEWNGMQLLEHIFAVNGQAKAMAAGVDVAADGSAPDVIGLDITSSYIASVAGVRAAFSDTAVRTRILKTPMGPFDGRVVLTVTSLEHLIHGWDLATTIGMKIELDDVAVGYAFRAVEDMPEVFANFRNWGAIALALTPEPDASAAERLLALYGRSWSTMADRSPAPTM